MFITYNSFNVSSQGRFSYVRFFLFSKVQLKAFFLCLIGSLLLVFLMQYKNGSFNYYEYSLAPVFTFTLFFFTFLFRYCLSFKKNEDLKILDRELIKGSRRVLFDCVERVHFVQDKYILFLYKENKSDKTYKTIDVYNDDEVTIKKIREHLKELGQGNKSHFYDCFGASQFWKY